MAFVASAHAADTVMVRGQSMYPNEDIIDNAVNSADYTKLVAALKAAGLVDTLKGKGWFTVFALTAAAFNKLPAGTVDNLVKPESKATLTYYVVPGKYDLNALQEVLMKGNGKAELKTAECGMLSFMMNGSHNIVVSTASGHHADISTYDVYQSNGVIQVIDTVLMPK